MIPLPFKDQKSANSVKREMQNLSAKIGVQIKHVFQSKKISEVLSPKEKKPPIVNNQCVVYKFQCDLCDTDYVGYTKDCSLRTSQIEKMWSVMKNIDILHISSYGTSRNVVRFFFLKYFLNPP